MTNKKFKHFLFVIAWMIPISVKCAGMDEIGEKHRQVAMRMIGHEVLICLGDRESRVLPVEKIGEHYRISFEFEFGFDPADIVSIVDRVMTKTGIATGYLVEVEQCENNAIVHSFEIRNAAQPDLIPCTGRLLPEDCYSLLITLFEEEDLLVNSPPEAAEDELPPAEKSSPDNSSLVFSKIKNANPGYLSIPLLVLIGFTAYFFRKKYNAENDPDLVMIGNYQLDKRNMTLTFENKSISLSHKEAELLSLLHTSVNVPIAREVILKRIWGDEGHYVGRTLDVFISKLRKKLKADASVKIINIRGVGYKLVLSAQG